MPEEEKHDEFDFDSAGEAPAYISLDQAVLQARHLARQDEARYLERLGWEEVVWTEISSEQREDSYRVVLKFRRPARGLQEEQTGEEEFLFDLTGVLQDRQVLLWPEGAAENSQGTATTAAGPDISATLVSEAPSPPQSLGPSPAPGTQPEAAEQPPESGAPLREGVPPGAVWVPDSPPVSADRLEVAPETAAILKCPNCRDEYERGQRYCYTCGEIVEARPQSLAPSPAPSRQPEAAEQPPESGAPLREGVPPGTVRVPDSPPVSADLAEVVPETAAILECPNCRDEYERGQRYCYTCGEIVEAGPTSPASRPPVPKAACTPRDLGPPVTRDTLPGAVAQRLEPASPVSEGIAPSGIPAADPSSIPAEKPEFALGKTGEIELRQILDEPTAAARKGPPVLWIAAAVVIIAAGVAGGVVFAMGPFGGDEPTPIPAAVVLSTATPTPSATATPAPPTPTPTPTATPAPVPPRPTPTATVTPVPATPTPTVEPLGTFLYTWGEPAAPGKFNLPWGIAVGRGGNIYVMDARNHRLQVFSSNGQVLDTWGVPFQFPRGMAVNAEGNIYVTDRGNSRIVVFSSNGQLLNTWGSEGSEGGQFDRPYGIAVNDAGVVYVADTFNHRVQAFSSSGQALNMWGSEGNEEGQFLRPLGIAVDDAGNMYVADTGNHRVQVFNSSGQLLKMWGSEGSEDGQFASPYGIAVDDAGVVYVADGGNNRVQVFASDGELLNRWGSEGSEDGQFGFLVGIWLDGTGKVYVTDATHDRVQVFSSEGRFLAAWGGKGRTGDGQFDRPAGVWVDASGNVHVTDSGNDRIQVFSSSGQLLNTWGTEGKEEGQFQNPRGIAVGEAGNVYVADTSSHRVQVFSSSGQLLGTWGTRGSEDGQFRSPFGIAVDEAGNVYVVDTSNDRVQVFSSSGQLLNTWGTEGSKDGQFSNPFGIALDATGVVYVADSGNDRVQVFSSSGQFLNSWGSEGSEDGQFRFPRGIMVDGAGIVYVADTGNNRVQVFRSSGQPLKTWGTEGGEDGQFRTPWGIAVSGGKVYATDSENHRMQVFSAGEPPPAPTMPPTPTTTAQVAPPAPTRTPTPSARRTPAPLTPTPFSEASILAALVKAGNLPPVEDRLPENPLVIDVVEEIGRYGGTMRRIFRGPGDVSCNAGTINGTGPMRWNNAGSEVIPHVAKSLEPNVDGSVWTMKLRKGMKWSDGAPLTADDFIFQAVDVQGNDELKPRKQLWWSGPSDDPVQVTKVNDTTVKFTYPGAYWFFPKMMLFSCTNRDMPFAPMHYLKQFHIKFNADADRTAKESGFDGWVQYFLDREDFLDNIDRPSTRPWLFRNTRGDPTIILERNPYFLAVDPEGNQLPYLDEVRLMLVEDLAVLVAAAMVGEVDFQGRSIQLSDFPALKEIEENGVYRVQLVNTYGGVDAFVAVNQTFPGELGDVLRNKTFRLGLAASIDRDFINQTAYLGLGTVRNVLPPPGHPHHPGPEYETMNLTYDPDLANKLLDEVIPNRGGDGFRTLPNGDSFEFLIDTFEFGVWPDVAEQTARFFQAVGINANARVLDLSLLVSLRRDNQLQASVWWQSETADVFFRPRQALPMDSGSFWAPSHGEWFVTGGQEGVEATEEIKRLVAWYRQGLAVPPEESANLAQKIYKWHVENQVQTGIVGMSPIFMGVWVVNKEMGNVPGTWANGFLFNTPWPAFPEQFFYRR